MHQFSLILAAVAFAIGALPKVAPSEINWTNLGLGLVVLALILG